MGREIECVISVIFSLKTLSREVRVRNYERTEGKYKENRRVFPKPVPDSRSLYF